MTGLIGADEHPDGLAAVVAQEPVYDLYRYLYSGGVRYENSLATPLLYDLIADTPGPLTDDPNYNAAALNDLTFDSIVGSVTMRGADHQLLRPSYLGQVEGSGTDLSFKILHAADPSDTTPEPSPDCKM